MQVLDYVFTLALLLGSVGIYLKRKTFQRFSAWHIATLYISMLLLANLILNALTSPFLLLPLAPLAALFLSWRLEKASALNGFFLNLTLAGFSIALLYLGIETPYYFVAPFFYLILILLGAGLTFGFAGLLFFLFLNARLVWKRERRSLANMLTLILGLSLLTFELFKHLTDLDQLHWLVQGLATAADGLLAYYFFLFINFLTASILYNLHRPAFNQDYIVTLGAGLIKGRKVSPLLSRRIQAAMAFAQKQEGLTGKYPTLIVSGGQGPDEQVSEAFAMAEAAIQMGCPPERVLLEEQSTTTFENFTCTKALLQTLSPEGRSPDTGRPRIAFATNNYHLLRAGIFAKKAGLAATGIGAKTAGYYLPNGFLREFAAHTLMGKKVHYLLSALILLGALIFAYLETKLL